MAGSSYVQARVAVVDCQEGFVRFLRFRQPAKAHETFHFDLAHALACDTEERSDFVGREASRLSRDVEGTRLATVVPVLGDVERAGLTVHFRSEVMFAAHPRTRTQFVHATR